MDMSMKKIRVIVSKVGLDGHDRGIKVVAQSLRDAGFEVVYLGLRQTPESVVEAALQEDADVIGVSSLSGAHMAIFPEIIRNLKKNNLEHVVLIGGGIIPEPDKTELESIHGVNRIFGPGTSTAEIIQYLTQKISR
jgi:methylmalonyl-CoA mutase, C-terminal domain